MVVEADKGRATCIIEEEKLYKDLKPHTPKTPSARPLLEIQKNPLKIRLVFNTQNSAVYKIGKHLSKELRQITT